MSYFGRGADDRRGERKGLRGSICFRKKKVYWNMGLIEEKGKIGNMKEKGGCKL